MANKITGAALVIGASSFQIPFRRKPRSPVAFFSDPAPPPPGCGPIPPPDTAVAAITNLGTSLRPRWVLQVSWVAATIRTLVWETNR